MSYSTNGEHSLFEDYSSDELVKWKKEQIGFYFCSELLLLPLDFSVTQCNKVNTFRYDFYIVQRISWDIHCMLLLFELVLT